jgi:hypothetical protein
MCNHSQARTLGAQNNLFYGLLLDEITRREVIEFVEEEDAVMDCSDDNNQVSSWMKNQILTVW